MTLPRTLLFVALLSPALAAVITDTVLVCAGVATYVDGGLYLRKLDNYLHDIVGDIGNVLNGTVKFTLNWAISDPKDDNSCCGPKPYMLLTEELDGMKFRRYNLTPYIDISPGAFAPLRFTSDNSTLTPGETSWGWMSVAGYLMWSPTGHLKEVAPPAKNGGLEVHPEQGWQLVSAGIPELYQIYWNQTKFEAGDTSYDDGYQVGQCGVDIDTPYTGRFVDDL